MSLWKSLKGIIKIGTDVIYTGPVEVTINSDQGLREFQRQQQKRVEEYFEHQRKMMEAYQRKIVAVDNALDMRIVDAARALDLEVYGFDKPIPWDVVRFQHYARGLYNCEKDFIALFPASMVDVPEFINKVLAHEIIHATGHVSRLARGHIGIWSKNPTSSNPLVDPADKDREERVADYGAVLLLEALGVHVPGAQDDCTKYLKKNGRPCGTPDETDQAQAFEAVQYVLMRLRAYETFKGDNREAA